jgi:Icc-related predicted phosphoesterase
MRLRVYSDIHLEFGPFSPPPVAADVIVIAGDLANGTRGIDWILEQFPDLPVVLVLGNHDLYYDSIPELTRAIRDRCAGTRIHLLENEAVSIAGYRFLGCTLWTDFELHGTMKASRDLAREWMPDYTCIELGSGALRRRLTPEDSQRFHAESRAWLLAEVERGNRARTIIVTHHASCTRSLSPDPSRSGLNPAFGSNLDALVESSGVPLWVHGHTHHNVDYRLGITRVVTNQRGYPDEPCNRFRPDGLLQL